MVKLTKLVIDIETGTETYIDLTDEEIAQLEANAIVYAEQKAAQEAEEAAKAADKASALAKLAALGLTEDEANALVK